MRTRSEGSGNTARVPLRRGPSRSASYNARVAVARRAARRATTMPRQCARRTRPVALTPRGFVPLIVH